MAEIPRVRVGDTVLYITKDWRKGREDQDVVLPLMVCTVHGSPEGKVDGVVFSTLMFQEAQIAGEIPYGKTLHHWCTREDWYD